MRPARVLDPRRKVARFRRRRASAPGAYLRGWRCSRTVQGQERRGRPVFLEAVHAGAVLGVSPGTMPASRAR